MNNDIGENHAAVRIIVSLQRKRRDIPRSRFVPKEPKTVFSFDEKKTAHIRFVMEYDFLPPSLMARFIIRMKSDIHNLNHLWRTGVELYNKPTKAKAIVKADKSEKRIDICVTGTIQRSAHIFQSSEMPFGKSMKVLKA